MPTENAVLRAHGLGRSFGPVTALRHVDLSLRPGEIHALVGENGAGKSTLIKLLTGAYQPSSGTLEYNGEPVSFASPWDAQLAGIQTVYQEVNLVPHLSVAHNVMLGREPRTRLGLVDVAAMRRTSQEALGRLGLDLDGRAPVGSLGLALQQMVAVARAVVAEAKVLILDESTASLEPAEVERLFSIARGLRDEGVALAFVSHRLDELWELCDWATILRDGQVVHSGSMSSLSRAELVGHMLGREPHDVSSEGATELEPPTRVESTEVLTVSGLGAPPRVQDVSLAVREGEILGLGGLLGSGRTETLQAIYGHLPTRNGEVRLDQREVPHGVRGRLRAGLALLTEDRKTEGIVPHLSVRDNIALAVLPRVSRWGVVSDRKVDEVADHMISRLQIKVSSRDQPVGSLSGGNQQKVLLARWLATEPRVLLLDEPTRGIDVGAKLEVQSLISELAERGMSVVLVSSEVEELIEGSTRLVVLHDGEVAATLDGDELTPEALMRALSGDQAQPARDAVLTQPDPATGR